MLDAGFGIAKVDRYIDKHKPLYILLSHLHLDHTVGLHALAKLRLKNSAKIYVPRVLKKQLDGFFAQPWTMPLSRLPFKTSLQAISEKTAFPGGSIRAAELIHTSPCFGYRITIGGKVITYCTDTGVCDNALKLAEGADLLITECALKKGQDAGDWPHLDPEHAATMAARAGAKKLVLTHFDAENYQSLRQRATAQNQAKKIFPAAVSAYDGMRITIK